MKKISNEYFDRFCDVIKRSVTDPMTYHNCLSNMISASKDNDGCFYNDQNYNMDIIKLDEYTKDFKILRRNETGDLKIDHQPRAVDAVCVNKENKWFLIEFKNQSLDEAIKSSKKKMLSSIWLIAFIYSRLSEPLSEERDVLKFSRENITYILVVNSAKNEEYIETIGITWDIDGAFYSPLDIMKYKGYYFKEGYVLTEVGLREFVKKFE